MINFTLDGFAVNPALNWDEINFTLKTEKEYNLFLQVQEYDLLFDSDGFDYIYDKIVNDSFCTNIICEIFSERDDETHLIFSGTIFLTDCEVNERTCTVRCKVSDRSFFASINNNKNIKTALNTGKTKNGLPLSDVTNYVVEVYGVLSNTYKYDVECCRIYDAFEYFVKFLSDNKLDFYSSAFHLGVYKELCITTGYRMRNGDPNSSSYFWPQFSFLELYQEINKRIPLILFVEDPYGENGNPRIRIEPDTYRYNNTKIYDANDIDEIITTFDTDKLFAKIAFGSPVDYNDIYKFPEAITFYGFRDEEFHLLGTCNLDLTLDLTANWIVSSNLIEKMVEKADQSYDKDIVLLDTEGISGSWSTTLARTTNSNFINKAPAYYYYNARLNNDNISQRYGQSLSAELASYYASSNEGECYVNISTNNTNNYANPNIPLTSVLLPLDTESYDYGNNFDTTLYRYTAPQNAVYTIKAQLLLYKFAWFGTNNGYFQHLIYHKDSSGTIKTVYPMDANGDGSIYSSSGFALVGGANPWYGTAIKLPGNGLTTVIKRNPLSISMVQGDYLEIEVNYWPETFGPGSTPPYTPGQHTGSCKWYIDMSSNSTFFQVTETTLFGGIFNNVNPDDLRIKLHKFNYPMTENEWKNILNNPIGYVKFAMNGQNIRSAWIREIKYSPVKGQAQFILNTSKATENGN